MNGPPSAHRIGLFGGRFDPVHRAHIAIARQVADALSLPQVRWIVSGKAEHKAEVASAQHRLEMVRLALAAMKDSRMLADDREIQAKSQGKSNFTADTLLGLQQDFPDQRFVWIMGEDQLEGFTTWSRWQWLASQLEFAVFARPHSHGYPIEQKLIDLGAKVHRINIKTDTISSSEIRNLLKQEKKLTDQVPTEVADYIARHHLYH
jgi:nicotinate-nucleotide adenylyltransferase